MSEKDCFRQEAWPRIDLRRCALIVIDPWATHHNGGHNDRLNGHVPKLVRLINLFRAGQRPIYYDSTGLPIHPLVLDGVGPHETFIEWDQMGGGTDVLNNLLVGQDINVLFWAGYNTNLCLMDKPCGFRSILKKDWDRFHFLVRDATIAFESRDTLADERLLDAACYEVEYYPRGFSCLIEDVAAALASGTA